MTTIPSLQFQVLVGCTFVDCLPQHVRRGAVFRALRKSGEPFLAAVRVLPDMQDSGIYIASEHGTADGVPFLAVPEVVELTAPAIDLGDD